MPLAKETVKRIRDLMNPAYEREARSLLIGRERWKVTRDTFEALSKIISGVASMVAFAAASIKDPTVADWLSFGSGCLGTTSLVMLLFANYSAKSSRARTRELNEILEVAKITPMPQLARETNAEGEIVDLPSSDSVRLDIQELKEQLTKLRNDVSFEIRTASTKHSPRQDSEPS